jgi:TRAP-type mannitol/chloroaromatic compound transport system permease small subunit
MQKILRTLVHSIDAMNTFIGRICAWLVIPLMLIIVFEVITRRFLHSPTIWTFEVSIQLFAFYFMLMAAYTLLLNRHVAVDVFIRNFSKRTQALISIITYLLFFFPFVYIIFIEGFEYAYDSWSIMETSYTVFAPPIYPLKTVIPLTALLLFLQGVSEVIKNVFFVWKRESL